MCRIGKCIETEIRVCKGMGVHVCLWMTPKHLKYWFWGYKHTVVSKQFHKHRKHKLSRQGCHIHRSAVLGLVAQSCPTFCDPMDCSPPGSFVHGILQAKILEWVAIVFSRGSSQPRDQTWVSCIADRFFALWATREFTIIYCSQLSGTTGIQTLDLLFTRQVL